MTAEARDKSDFSTGKPRGDKKTAAAAAAAPVAFRSTSAAQHISKLSTAKYGSVNTSFDAAACRVARRPDSADSSFYILVFGLL